MVAMQMAASYPDRVERLGLVCTSAYLPPAAMWLERAATVRQHGMPAVVDIVTQRWFTPAFAAGSRARDLRAGFQNVPAEGYASSCEAIAAMDLRPALAAIGAPTLVIAAAEDPATPAEHAGRIVDGINGGRGTAQVTVVPGAHLAAVEQPEVVAHLLLEHWTSSPLQTEERHG
jgi:3-oxoadipate enol-lactonase